ncbi:dynein regulatory complex subunit 7 [Centropristis striata]|uniref:dynein regulatory complex subunit 7 n=1 Tax=Centropristis striata TaxID=184440 RepID=UPI0027DEFD3B|nr:dynein regulatory complex subunit 7 [Centropristis striata]
METVLESEKEEEEEDREAMKLEGPLHVSAPRQHVLKLDNADDLSPESYRVNSPAEIRLLAVADNFQRQYSHLYPDRKPLLLCPFNECGVQKFVSTTLRPTPTVYPELFTWEGCASFVANFLSLDPLEPPVDLPRYLFSSSSVLQSQKATCFDFATLLCSLLLGSHYDAYCVSGYAVKELCVLEQSLKERPLLDTELNSVISAQELQENKYTVKPPRELKSHFLTQQEKKKQDAEAALLQKQKLHEESERRPADPLRGLRVHCWVLVLSGSRSVRQNFFIDPLSGKGYATDHDNFLGIESVWNNLNYYVNMQDCRNGCAGMVYDLEDLQMWEPVLYGATSKKQLILDVLDKKERQMISKKINEEEDEEQPKVFQMPRSWVSYITISKKDLETCWPGGQRVTRYRKSKLETFAAYLRKDGLVTRQTTYKDADCTEVTMVKEWYQYRKDHLEEREMDNTLTTERFRRGRPFNLLLHRFTSLSSDLQHEMEFSSARVDDLVRRVDAPSELTEFFEGRSDFLYYRHVQFDQRVSFADTPEDRPLLKVVECFHRNRSKPASKDVAERVFLVDQRRIELTFHLEDYRVVPSKMSFIKPRESTENKKKEEFTPDMVSSFQVEPADKPLQTLALCSMLDALIKDEEKMLLQVKESKKEVSEIVRCREQEEADVQLIFSPWTTVGAARARSKRQEMLRRAVEEQRWLQEKEKDLLAPLLIRHGPEPLSAQQAEQLHRDCLAEFKQRLTEQADLIQERYEKETEELQKKQQLYQKNQVNMTELQRTEYQNYCSDKMLRIGVARKRLSMHKESAPQKYQSLDLKLKQDPRLAPHLLR